LGTPRLGQPHVCIGNNLEGFAEFLSGALNDGVDFAGINRMLNPIARGGVVRIAGNTGATDEPVNRCSILLKNVMANVQKS
jgi:hypothetical protein